jgi:tetratricopeptide (TPR) repeat protein
MLNRTFTVLLFSLFALFARGTDNEKLAAEANQAYIDGQFNNAIALYLQIVESGHESHSLYYNLGNAYFKVHDIPSAILYYEKAWKLRPGDENTLFNLKVAQTRIIDKIDELPRPFYVDFWNTIRVMFPLHVWSVIILVFLTLTFLSAAAFLLARSILMRKAAFWFGMVFFGVTVLSGIAAWSQYHYVVKVPEAIVFDPTVHVKSSPDAGSIDLFVIHEGTKVRITDQIGEWQEVRIANGSMGWIRSSAVKRI